MEKIDFIQYTTKDTFLKAFPIKNGKLDLENKGITDADLTHILKLLGEEPNLKWLYLNYNQLTSISANAFIGLTNLKELSLSNNQITTLSDNTFGGLTNLEWLYLNHNQITTLSANTFGGLTNLQELGLNYNQFPTLPNLRKALPNCRIYKDHNVVWVDEAKQETVKQAPVECGNCINEIKNKITNIELEISKLQEDKEVLQKALQIMINN